ncbi:MAG: SRPBCC domain-containing protein [Methylophilus sp.]
MISEERTLATSRTLPYTPREIYGAFASADLLAAWWGPDGFTNTFEIFEFKTGGRWIFVMHSPDEKAYANESIFRELVKDAKVVIDHVCQPLFTLTVELTPVTDGTHLSWQQAFDDAQTAQAVKKIVGPANEQNIDRLTQVLGKVASPQ